MSLTATARSIPGTLRQDILVDGRHRLTTDQPERVGGEGTAPAPHELFPAALAGCVASTLALYARTKEWDLGEVTVDVDYDHHATPRRVQIDVRLTGDLDPAQLTRLRKVAAACPLRRSIESRNRVRGAARMNRVRHGTVVEQPGDERAAWLAHAASAPACSTSTACSRRRRELHAEAWKEMFDAFLRDRSARTGGAVRPVRPATRLRAVRRRAGPATTASARSSPRAGSTSTPATVPALGEPQERARARADPAARARAVRGIGAVRAGRAGRRAAPGGRLGQRELPRRARGGRDLTDLFEVRVDAARAEESTLRGKPAPDTFLAAARALDVEPAEAAVFEDALAGVAAGRAGRFGFVVGVDRTGHADALREPAPTSSSPTWPSCWSADERPAAIRGRALVGARDAPRPRRARQDGVDVRARQRAHRPAREPRRGRAVRPARART